MNNHIKMIFYHYLESSGQYKSYRWTKLDFNMTACNKITNVKKKIQIKALKAVCDFNILLIVKIVLF